MLEHLSELFSATCSSSCETFLDDLKQRMQYDCVTDWSQISGCQSPSKFTS